jgi:MraZ protein
MEAQDATRIFFTDRYEHSVDAKGRVTLPAQYRRYFPSESVAYFVPAAHGEPCIRVFPLATWAQYDEKYLERQDEFEEPRVSRKIRDLYSRIKTVSVDKAGRVLLPDEFVTSLGLGGKVLMAGHRDHFEIWDPQEFGRFMESGHEGEESR